MPAALVRATPTLQDDDTGIGGLLGGAAVAPARSGGLHVEVGKSTIAVHLAVEAAKASSATSRDTASATSRPTLRWKMRTDGVVTCPPARLGATLDAAKRTGALVAIIDTAPHAEAPALAA